MHAILRVLKILFFDNFEKVQKIFLHTQPLLLSLTAPILCQYQFQLLLLFLASLTNTVQ